MRFLAAVLRPLVFILSASSTGLLRLFGASGARPQPVSEEEIKVMIDQGIEHGMFEEAERDMIEGVFDLGDRRVNELMTPRTDVVWLDVEDSREDGPGEDPRERPLALPRLPRRPGHGARHGAGQGHPQLRAVRRGPRPREAVRTRRCTCPRTPWR